MIIALENKAKLDIFVALFQLLKSWNSCIQLCFDKEHISIQTMDKSHVCLVNITISSKWFSQYDVVTNTSFTVDTNQFSIILNYALKHNKLEINYDENENPDVVYMNLLNSKEFKTDSFDHFFELPLMEVEHESFDIPETEYAVDMSIESKKFSELITELNVFGTELNIKCSEDAIELLSSGGESGKMKVSIPIDDLNEYAINEGESIDVFYSLNHVGKMCTSTKLSNEIGLSMSPNEPMVIKYNLGDDSIATFYVAPKIV